METKVLVNGYMNIIDFVDWEYVSTFFVIFYLYNNILYSLYNDSVEYVSIVLYWPILRESRSQASAPPT